MFKLEKVFQNDDLFFIRLINLIKSLLIILSSYIFIMLNNNSFYELFKFEIFINSNYLFISISISICFFILSFFFWNSPYFKKNFLYFIKKDLLNLFLSSIIVFIFIFFFKRELYLEINLIYIFLSQTFFLIIIGVIFISIYEGLINKNIIQINVMIIGKYQDIKKIIHEKLDKKYIFKCSIVEDTENLNMKLVKSEFKFPIFDINRKNEIRSILEYHSLGQIWIINGDKIKHNLLSEILKYPVDSLNIILGKNLDMNNKKLFCNKYNYEFYEKSKFYGVNLFIKLLSDKVLSVFFLIILSPIMILCILLIYIEDGLPIIFTQDRIGWDGRRFKIFKLRSLKKESFDKTVQVTKNDKRVLKIGKFVRKYSIDEVPQFVNVLLGEMSIVGPRPHMVEHDIYYSKMFVNFLKRHKANPGLTGWAQVNGIRGSTTPHQMKLRMKYDLWYLDNWSIKLDLIIIFKTFFAIFKFKGE